MHSWGVFFCSLDYVFFKTGVFVFYDTLFISVSLFMCVFLVLVCIVVILFFLLILSMSSTALTFSLFSYVLEHSPWFLSQLVLDMFFFSSELQFEAWILCMEEVKGKSSLELYIAFVARTGSTNSRNFVKCPQSRFFLPNLGATFSHCSYSVN